MRQCVIINVFARRRIPADRQTLRDVFTFVPPPPPLLSLPLPLPLPPELLR
jgi:hypothetical protein